MLNEIITEMKSELDTVRTLYKDIVEKGHGKEILIQRLQDVLNVSKQHAEDLVTNYEQQSSTVTETGKYWSSSDNSDNNEYDKFFKELVPAAGASKMHEGELLRAISKIYYDFYNNGFGNNWSGAYNFLVKHGLKGSATVARYKNGRVFRGENTPTERTIEKWLDDTTDAVIKILKSKEGKYTPHEDDMFNHDDEPAYLYQRRFKSSR